MSKCACLFVLGYCRLTLRLVTVCALGQTLKKEHANRRFISRRLQMNYLSKILFIWTIFFSVEYNSLGCFKDGTPRALPLLLKNFRVNIDWTDMTKTVRACAEIAKERGHLVFGIQYYGECWSGPDTEDTYNKYGPSGNCWNGVGKEGTNYVYKIWVKVPVFVEIEGLNIWHNNP